MVKMSSYQKIVNMIFFIVILTFQPTSITSEGDNEINFAYTDNLGS